MARILIVEDDPLVASFLDKGLSAHGYLGKEDETVEAIVNWMLKRPFRSEIN